MRAGWLSGRGLEQNSKSKSNTVYGWRFAVCAGLFVTAEELRGGCGAAAPAVCEPSPNR